MKYAAKIEAMLEFLIIKKMLWTILFSWNIDDERAETSNELLFILLLRTKTWRSHLIFCVEYKLCNIVHF